MWYEHVEYSLIVSRRNATQPNNDITLHDMKIPFVIWLIGLMIASVVFCLEKCSHLFSSRR